MKILTPTSSSTPLTLSEVSHHLSTHPIRKPDPRVGAYPIVDLNGYRNVRREVERYVQSCTPWCSTPLGNPLRGGRGGEEEREVREGKGGGETMEELVRVLKPWGLSWGEVGMVCDLGVGRDRRRFGSGGGDLMEEEEKARQREEMRESDERVLGCVFEEGRYEESELKQIVEAVEEVVRGLDGAVVLVEGEGRPVQSVEAVEAGEGRRVTRSSTKQAQQEESEEEEEDVQDPIQAIVANLKTRVSKLRAEPRTRLDEGKAVINKYELRRGGQSYVGVEDEGDDDEDSGDMLVDEQAAVSRELSED